TSVSGYDMSIKGGAVDVRQTISGIPDQFSLAQNFPNPFNPTTTISFQVTKSEFVSLKIFDVLGREVETLVNSVLNPGTYDVEWDADNASGGVYYYKLSTPSFSEIKKMVLAK
ncbi:MAG TPA: T9SS type A sorting domain-containing protein, partial [Bacteroidota bacterium]|nr:T9SS type A sorting domain-containing protein [Bacteroidota bacterium]